MSEEKVYKDGDIVWVKLGHSWWPGEVVADEKRLPDDVHQLKKKPYCVVKFFQEDAYEYPKTAKQVYPFQCPKKDEFIRKGLALYNAKKSFMEKFPDDIKHAECLTKPTAIATRIINERPGGLVKEMWGHGITQRSTDFYENSHVGGNGNVGTDFQNHATLRRDSVTTILNITPNRASISLAPHTPQSATLTRTLSTSSCASITPNTSASSQYRCNLCDFTTMRQNVLIMHRKSHSSSGTVVPSKSLTFSTQSSNSLTSSSFRGGNLNVSLKSANEDVSTTGPSTPLGMKDVGKDKSSIAQLKSAEKKNVELTTNESNTTSRTRKRASATPSPRVVTSKRTLRNLRNTEVIESATSIEEERKTTDVEASLRTVEEETITKKSRQTGSVSPTDSKNSEQIRQRLLADWSDEDKDENHEDVVPSSSRKNRSSNTLKIPTINVANSMTKRRSPTIVPMKTLEGEGQTLVVAAATQSNTVQEVNTKISQRIRNIPKKDRLRDFGNNVSTLDEQPKINKTGVDIPSAVVATSGVEKPMEKPASVNDVVNTSETNTSSAILSCFDFQEDEEEAENDVLKSIANYKKKYFSPDKDKSGQLLLYNEHTQAKAECATEQRDKDLSAEIDSLLEQTTVITQTLKEDIVVPASVKGLPIKERGKRIFKSRNRARTDDDETATEEAKKSVEALETNTNATVEEIKQESNVPASISSLLTERKTRGTRKRSPGKNSSKDGKTGTSPVNGNGEEDKTSDKSFVESPSNVEPVQAISEKVSQRSRRKPYNHRIMRQQMNDEETSIPFIRHSPVEIYSCDSSMDNGTHSVRDRRSKTTTPNSLTLAREENINGNSRASSRNMQAAPPTPTDETSSLGVSDAGAEFGSPASSLDDERLLTPVQDVNNQHGDDFKPINENKVYDKLPADDNNHVKKDTIESVEDEEIESPPHEALSGNELDEHDTKEDTKRLKSPKKRLNAKEQQKQAIASTETKKLDAKRKSRTGTPLPSGDDLPKRLRRGYLQHQEKDSSEAVQEMETSPPTRTRSLRGSPASADLRQKLSISRSTPTRASSRHAATKQTADLSLSEEVGSVREQVRSTDQIEVDNFEASTTDTTKPSTLQHMAKGRRSKTPVMAIEREKLTLELDPQSKVSQKATDLKCSNKSENDSKSGTQNTPENMRHADQEHLKEVKDNKTQQVKSPKLYEQDSDKEKYLSHIESNSNSELATPEKSVDQKYDDELKATAVESFSFLKDETSLKKKSENMSIEATAALSADEKFSCTRVLHNPSDKSSHTNYPPILDNNYSSSADMHSDDKNSTQSPTKKISRWDSPHSSDKKNSSIDSLLSPDKKSSSSNNIVIPDKKLSRWDSPHSLDKKSSVAVSPHSPNKKHSRWDSPTHTDKKIKMEDPKMVTTSLDESKGDKIDHLTIKEKKSEDSKLKSNDPSVDGNVTASISDVTISSSLSTSALTETSTEENVKTIISSQTPTKSSKNNSPIVEKVRINVDVANPLSTQIANILAASGNNMNNQQQLQLGNLNKSPKSNVSSPLKRKHSLEEANVIGTSETDGDAVVAHVQSLCPQVKITRKERVITPAMESVTSPLKKSTTSQNTNPYDISQMPIVISNEQISAPKKSPKLIAGNVNALSASNLWQTDLLQAPTNTPLLSTNDSQDLLQNESVVQKYASRSISPSSGERNLNSLTLRSSQSPSPQKSPAAVTGGRKQAGNTVALPSSITVKQHEHKFAEALALADSVLGSSSRPTKRRSSQTTPTSSPNVDNVNANRRLNSAPALDIRSNPPAKVPKITSNTEQVNQSPTKVLSENSPIGKTWSQSHRPVQKQKKIDSPNEAVVEPDVQTASLPETSSSPTKINNEEIQNVTEVEQLNNTAKITAVPIQPIPGYADSFLLCMLVDNIYKPINNIPHYLNTDLNQLVPVPPEAYEGMLPELAVDQPPASSADNETTPGRISDQQQQHQMTALNQEQHKSESLMGIRDIGESSICNDGTVIEETGLKLVLQPGEPSFADSAAAVDPDISDGAVESATDNAIVLNLENQQIILDVATFEQLLANPDANTQLVTDDGTEFVLTREVLTALKAQHDSHNVELLAIPGDQQQLQEQLIVAGGISEAGSSADLLSVALANSEFYGNEVLQIETTLGSGVGAAGLQLLASDGSIVFQAPPLPQAHLTPPITAHTSETNAVLNRTPIMSTLEKPSTAVVGAKCGIESPTAAVVSAVECDIPRMRPNLDDSLAVIGVSTQSSTVPTSLELPITITNPAIAPKVTMAQSAAHAADLVQFQTHRSVATASAAASTAVAHMYEDPIEGMN